MQRARFASGRPLTLKSRCAAAYRAREVLLIFLVIVAVGVSQRTVDVLGSHVGGSMLFFAGGCKDEYWQGFWSGSADCWSRVDHRWCRRVPLSGQQPEQYVHGTTHAAHDVVHLRWHRISCRWPDSHDWRLRPGQIVSPNVRVYATGLFQFNLT